MTIGDIRWETPAIDSNYGGNNNGELGKPRKCRVIYIHPEGRFYRVEFDETHIRESYINTDRCIGVQLGHRRTNRT